MFWDTTVDGIRGQVSKLLRASPALFFGSGKAGGVSELDACPSETEAARLIRAALILASLSPF